MSARSTANKTNAQASTGPRTAAGRARSALNALRHGLTAARTRNPTWAADVERLTAEIAGSDANADIRDCARRVAEAHIEIVCARRARHQVISKCMSTRYYESRANVLIKARLMRLFLCRNPPNLPIDERGLERILCAAPQGAKKFILILRQESRELLTFDRYERRALSRRQAAIEALDEVRRCHSGILGH